MEKSGAVSQKARGPRRMKEERPLSQRAVSPGERERMIAEAAYYRALERGFAGGDPVADWLEAEAEIDGKLGLSSSEQRRLDRAAYERLRLEVGRFLGEVRGTVGVDTIREAIERGTVELREIGEYTAETVQRASESLKREVSRTAERLGPAWEGFSEKTAGLFDVWLDRGSDFLRQAGGAVKEWLHGGGRLKAARYHRSGEDAPPGDYECAACGARMALEEKGSLPSCPKCGGGDFRPV